MKGTYIKHKRIAALNLTDWKHSSSLNAWLSGYIFLTLTGFSFEKFKSQLCHLEAVWAYQSSPSFNAPLSSPYSVQVL